MECGSAALLSRVWKCSVVEYECGSAALLSRVCKYSVVELSVEVQRC